MSARTTQFPPEPLLANNPHSNGSEAEIKTALISDNDLLRSALQQIFPETPFVLVEVASVEGSGRLRPLASQPALVLIEASQGIPQVLEVVRQVRECYPEARIVTLADQFDFGFVRLWHEAGADGLCIAGRNPEVLIKSLQLVMLGETVLPIEALRSISDGIPQSREEYALQANTAEPNLSDLTVRKLSAREAQILGCLKEGAPNKVIARKLAVTEATIKVHIKSILRKIGVANRTQAAIWATAHLPPRGGTVQHL
jgi:two-component system, NarL family, nitrate/nitrite response regulator NarL